MSKNIFEELPSRKGTPVEARPEQKGANQKPAASKSQSKKSGIGASDVEQGADPKAKSEKRIRQAVYDIRYRARREDITLGQALSQYMQNSKLTPQEQAAVKSQLKEEYEVADMISDATTNALYRVFVMNETNSEKVNPAQEYIEELKATPERKYHVRVTDKNTGKTYYRYATREKVNQLRANPNIKSVEMLDKMDPTYGKPPYEGERKRGEQTARVKAGKGLDPVGKEDKDIDNDGDHDKSDKYLLNRRKKIGQSIATRKESLDPVGKEDKDIDNDGDHDKSDRYLLNRRKARGKAIATRKEDFIWSEETTSTEGQNKKKITGAGVDNYSTGVVKVSPDENSGVKKEEYSSALKKFHSSLQFEAAMTSAEKDKERQLKKKYDKSGMKASMKKQYGERGEDVYFATIRKQAMQKAHYEFEDGTLLDEMGMPILGVVKKDSEKKEGSSCDTNGDDMRSLPTKVNLVKNKMRAMGLKMSYEPNGEDIQEIPLVVAAPLAAGALWAAGKGMEAMKGAVDKKIDKARKTSVIGGDRRAPQMNSYETFGTTISEREMDEPGEEDWRPDVQAHNRAVGYRGGYKPYRRGYRGPKPGTSGPGSQAKPAD